MRVWDFYFGVRQFFPSFYDGKICTFWRNQSMNSFFKMSPILIGYPVQRIWKEYTFFLIISDDSLFWTWMGGISKFDTMLILYEYDFWVKNIKIPPKKDLVISRYLCRYKYGCNLQIHTAAISPILMILHKKLEKSKKVRWRQSVRPDFTMCDFHDFGLT